MHAREKHDNKKRAARVSDGEGRGSFKKLGRCVLGSKPLGTGDACRKGWIGQREKDVLEGGGGFGSLTKTPETFLGRGEKARHQSWGGENERSKGTVDLRPGQEISTFRVLVGGWERWGWMQDRTGQS
ncbi:hypothetical protein T310_3183 [Rasamsonia emersonii CBS 393.64]|uniref:Uncharacterized protein n=1 Tax=Rasamsonia emersonii (strain ATCC 16479 / CBS 393.64 / IMI 116815) TaxID=1408163 RepID=A0A0F4YYV1_RASE3|nr:hypothetical protein T310_3183 [Rasamsonia emersonii CBS 393.64]KKA22798.1 hypothetical protein T310_3183 [Rasamsonia emersonii CBS 393.64]